VQAWVETLLADTSATRSDGPTDWRAARKQGRTVFKDYAVDYATTKVARVFTNQSVIV